MIGGRGSEKPSHCAVKTLWESLTTCNSIIGQLQREISSARESNAASASDMPSRASLASGYRSINVQHTRRDAPRWVDKPIRHYPKVFGIREDAASAHLLARAVHKNSAAPREIATRPMERGNDARDFRRILTSRDDGESIGCAAGA